MPYLTKTLDRSMRTLTEWRDVVVDQVQGIEVGLYGGGWHLLSALPGRSNDLHSLTMHVSWICMRHMPMTDPMVFQSVLDIIITAHENRTQLPTWSHIQLTVDRAMLVRQMMEATINRQASEYPPGTIWQDETLSFNERIESYIDYKKKKGSPIHRISRDGIANALRVAGGSVSKSPAWKALRQDKDRESLPSNANEAALMAMHRGDWKSLQRIQEQEERRNN